MQLPSGARRLRGAGIRKQRLRHQAGAAYLSGCVDCHPWAVDLYRMAAEHGDVKAVQAQGG